MKKSNLKMILFVFYIVLFTAYVQAETHITTNLNMIIEGDEITEGEVVLKQLELYIICQNGILLKLIIRLLICNILSL